MPHPLFEADRLIANSRGARTLRLTRFFEHSAQKTTIDTPSGVMTSISSPRFSDRVRDPVRRGFCAMTLQRRNEGAGDHLGEVCEHNPEGS